MTQNEARAERARKTMENYRLLIQLNPADMDIDMSDLIIRLSADLYHFCAEYSYPTTVLLQEGRRQYRKETPDYDAE